MAGHCYVVSEALHYLSGGLLRPRFVRHEGAPHWFLTDGERIIDPTASQFLTPVPYDLARGKGFLTARPSKRAKRLITQAVLHGAYAGHLYGGE